MGKTPENYLELNRASWNQKVAYHIESEFYDHKSFLSGESTLKDIELGLLGDLKGKSILHLQCHFGQDTISLERLGAKVTGIDLSDKAIEQAKQTAEQTKSNARFICCDLYDLPNHLHEEFDMVFTSYGTIGWLPDLNRWAQVISTFLKPQGTFVFVEFHPVVWIFDDSFSRIAYSYFNTGPITQTTTGTYADSNAPITTTEVSWNHSISEVVTSLIQQGLSLKSLTEYDYSPYACFEQIQRVGDSKYRIKHLHDHIPMVYAIKAVKE